MCFYLQRAETSQLFLIADRSFVVANAQHGLCHIIYCSDGFCRLSGYSRAEVMQRSAACEFLYGPLTSQHAIAVVKEALAVGAEKHFEILYYRKDGKPIIRHVITLFVVLHAFHEVNMQCDCR